MLENDNEKDEGASIIQLLKEESLNPARRGRAHCMTTWSNLPFLLYALLSGGQHVLKQQVVYRRKTVLYNIVV